MLQRAGPRIGPTTSSCVEVTMVPQADELWMVCFYTELRGRAPNGILEQIGPLGINAHGDPDKGASMMPMLPTW